MTANKIPFSENLNLINMLTDAATVGSELSYLFVVWLRSCHDKLFCEKIFS